VFWATFSLLDAHLAQILAGEELRLLAWAILAGFLSMILYRRCSNQQRLAELEIESVSARKALSEYQGEFSGALPLIQGSLSLSMQRVQASLLPSLVAGLPVCVVFFGVQPLFEQHSFVPIGPDWMRSWLAAFLVGSGCSALLTKMILRIR
jgi:hypothetical protein